MTTPPRPADPRTQEILAPGGSTATGVLEQHATAPATDPPSVRPAPADPGTDPQPAATSEPPPPSHGAPTAVVPAPEASAPAGSRRTPQDRGPLVGAGLAALGFLLLELGLVLRPDGPALWGEVPLWSAFATLCALLGGGAAAARLLPALRLPPAVADRLAPGGLTGLAVFWVLVVLPRADTDRGFVLTAALAALGAAVWLVPGRRR